MKLTNKLGSLALFLGVLGISSTGLAQFDVPDDVTIENMTYGGTGCPIGTVAENVADDKMAFTLLFDEFVAEVGPGISRREARKFCQLNLELSHSAGWSFAIIELDTRGYVGLDRRVTATQKTSFYFQGSDITGHVQEDFTGVMDDDYETNHVIPVDEQLWSPCDASRSLNIKTQVRLNNRRNRNGTGLITADSVDGHMVTLYGLAWKRCPGWEDDQDDDDDDWFDDDEDDDDWFDDDDWN